MSDSSQAAPAAEVAQEVPPSSNVPQSPEAVKQESAPSKKKYQTIIDGQAEEVELSDEDIVKAYQKGKSADKRFQEAAQMKKQLESFVMESRNNPLLLLQELGVDVSGFKQSIIEQQIQELLAQEEESQLTPEQLRVRELEKKLGLYEEERKKLEEQRLKEQENAAFERVDTDLANFFQKSGVTSPTPRLIARMAEQMLAVYKATGKEVSAQEAFESVSRGYVDDYAEAVEKLPDEVLDKLLDDKMIQRILNLHQKRQKGKAVPTLGNIPKPEQPKNKLDPKLLDFFTKG